MFDKLYYFLMHPSYQVSIMSCLILNLVVIWATLYIQHSRKISHKNKGINKNIKEHRFSRTFEMKYFSKVTFQLFILATIAAFIALLKNINLITTIALLFFVAFLFLLRKFFLYFISELLGNKVLKELSYILIIGTIVYLYNIKALSLASVANVQISSLWETIYFITIGLLVIGLAINIIYTVKGISECIVSPSILSKKYYNDNDFNESKIKILIAWFIIVFLNSQCVIYLVSKLDPSAFVDIAVNAPNGGTPGFYSLAYFNLITLLTIGYGDITPRGFGGRLAVMIISIVGAFYMIIAVASILSATLHKTKSVHIKKFNVKFNRKVRSIGKTKPMEKDKNH